MFGFTVKLSVLASVLLICTNSGHALSAAGAQVLAQANTFLNNASIPQEYKVILLLLLFECRKIFKRKTTITNCFQNNL